MEARLVRVACAATLLMLCGASYRTPNFVVQAPTDEFARAVGDTAEQYRRDLAIEWLGQAMPNWVQPCPIRVSVAENLGAGGATSFVFDRGEVFGWDMQIQGPPDRILDSVLPHEVTHTIFASHFRQPLPRWADEGACTTVEHNSERRKQGRMLIEFLQTGRGIAFSKMFAMKDYPADILPLYSQGHSLASYLIDQGGKREFMRFVKDGLDGRRWSEAVAMHYGFNDLGQLQTTWLDWVRQGSPMPVPVALRGRDSGVQLVSGTNAGNRIYRGQSADTAPTPEATASVYDRRGRGPLATTQAALPATDADDNAAWRPSGPNASPAAPSTPPAGEQLAANAAPNGAGQVILEWSRDQAATGQASPPRVAAAATPQAPVFLEAAVPQMSPLRR
ncbi:MAG: hypothetical protein K1X74_14130 [Pirellulales bacterium]|nr:hypothetical protein [Pirellulales bacterium]